MTATHLSPHTPRSLLAPLLCTALLATCHFALAQTIFVYRCPGPPVVYTDAITKAEAKSRDCKLIGPDRWVEVEKSGEVLVSVDAETLERTGPLIRVWLKRSYTRPRKLAANGHISFSAELELLDFNCRNRSASRLEIVRYSGHDETGLVVDRALVPEINRSTRRVVPNSFDERVLLSVCEVQRR